MSDDYECPVCGQQLKFIETWKNEEEKEFGYFECQGCDYDVNKPSQSTNNDKR